MAIVLPTVFFLFSQLLRYVLKTKTKRIIGTDKVATPAGTISLGLLPRFLGEQSTREFRFEFFIDSTILSMANGLILAFELAKVEYGVIALILGVVLSVAGFVATETERNSSVSWLFFALCLFFISEAVYFTTFGTRTVEFGFTLLPWHMFLLPTFAFLSLVVFVMVIQTVRKLRHTSPRQNNIA